MRGLMLQEILIDDPWKMMVGCILLNQTARIQVDKVYSELFSKWPTAAAMASANENELSELLKPTGLHRRKARSIRKFSSDWHAWSILDRRQSPLPSGSVLSMYGMGQYSVDSYKIFVLGDMSVVPRDKELRAYLESKGVSFAEQ